MPGVVRVTDTPNLPLLYARAAATSFAKGEHLPDETLVHEHVRVERDRLTSYTRVCAFPLTDQVPLTYPHILAFPLAVQLMARRSFPLPLPGLVHVRNTVTQHRAIRVDEAVTVRVRAQDLRPHPKGRQFDVVSLAEADGETVWEEVSTYMRRGKSHEGADASRSLACDDLREVARWQVRKDTGRRYARVSGDVNPIHLHPLTARLFGFRRPIAHGMWTKARAVAALADRLPDRCTVEVDFRKPLLLPADVVFAIAERDEGWAFAVRSKGGDPHLFGAVTAPVH